MMSDDEMELSALRNELKENFKPIFDKHGPGGLPAGDLRRELKKEVLLDHIPRPRQNELLEKADRDADKLINYEEFVRMVTQDFTKEERNTFKGVMSVMMPFTLSRRQRKDFLANYTCCPPPIFIPLISVVQLVVFIVYVFDLRERGTETTSTSGVAMYSPLVYKATRRYEAWRFLTYMLMHQGYLHIISNLGFQIVFGTSLEVVHKWWRVGLVYLLGVIAGGLAHSITDHSVGLVGASGGVYALFGAHMAAIVINWKEMNYKCMETEELEDNDCCCKCRILLSAPVRLALILLLVVPDTGVAIYRRISEPAANKIGVTAHIGGFLAGLTLGIAILKNVNSLAWERNLGWVTLAVYLAFFAFCCFFNTFYDGYPASDWTS